MSQTYKIKAVGSTGDNAPREWEGKYGKMIDYKLKLEDVESIVTLSQKPDSKPPVEGQELTGTIDMSAPHGPKFKKEKPAFQSGGAGKPRETSPEDKESIARSVALKAAVDALQASTQSKGQEFNVDEYIQVAEKFLAWLKERPNAPKDTEPRYEPQDF